ncbi:hypothetical protein QH07_004003 [Salmonella enterica subsp. enterica]|uniref:Uncharacterized protein n=1 Tax=Salmonella enterica subsp. enterica serovar Bovismorbificans TaxID=58097 RepID=A0A655EFI9_SALET|nr:hypothetical protein [Salmonella enterica subsp. enterica serovar Bovismorbificans]EEJ1748523.1 hypothetical protein [Salmonella enterica subsp. enterica]CDF56881.1 unnamed protein product [Salmonella enterica subsp. enterica serovar Bovismorbificans str. 3114]EDQ3250515.1 hypothetical protein [Salmonella enterica subsp. enterica serovar Bovismorbificans]EDS6714869.1 hypothetical protein [Salmonella enterica subsp. enterica serovar Bovismorbificans]
MMPADKTPPGTVRRRDIPPPPLRALILLLLTSVFISGFLAGVLAMLWLICRGA